MKRKHFRAVAALLLATLTITSCSNKKFQVSGAISDAKDSLLYLENMSLNGPVAVDSIRLGDDGTFSFDGPAPSAPEFYRLRIAGQMINIAIDSTEQISVRASYPSMSSQYEVQGSAECAKIKELALLQLNLQRMVDAIVQSPSLGVGAVTDSVETILRAYKNTVVANYIYKEPMKAYSYFALFQTFLVGNQQMLIFNPRADEQDVKTFAAVATSWDTFYPKAERGLNLHNIAIEGMKNLRIVRAEQQQRIDPSKVNVSGVIDIALPDNRGTVRHLNQLGGKVVLLDFHIFADKQSPARIMMLRELYNKYHSQGFEIYQVSLDPDEHFWKTSVSALPWLSVRDDKGLGSNVMMLYNVQHVPTYYLIDKSNTLYKRDSQIQDLDTEIRKLL